MTAWTQINFRVSPELLAAIDALRGEMTRPAWIKQAVEDMLADPVACAEFRADLDTYDPCPEPDTYIPLHT